MDKAQRIWIKFMNLLILHESLRGNILLIIYLKMFITGNVESYKFIWLEIKFYIWMIITIIV